MIRPHQPFSEALDGKATPEEESPDVDSAGPSSRPLSIVLDAIVGYARAGRAEGMPVVPRG
jgi:hypothetical protein